MNFADLAAAAAHFDAVARNMEQAPQRIVETGSMIILVGARSMPGHYEKGWPKLKPETIERKAKGDSPPLETGALRNSFERTVGNREAWIGTNDEKIVWMEFGTSRGIPPRPVWLTIANKAGPSIEKIARAEVARVFAMAGAQSHALKEALHAAHKIYEAVKRLGEDLVEGDGESKPGDAWRDAKQAGRAMWSLAKHLKK